MKKILIVLIMLFSFLTAKSQTFLRSEGAVMGVKNPYTGEVTWGEKKIVDILIKIEQNKATIYSKQQQIFRKIALVESDEQEMITWRCSDDNGIICNFSLMLLEDRPEYICVIVEYKDTVLMYVTKKE